MLVVVKHTLCYVQRRAVQHELPKPLPYHIGTLVEANVQTCSGGQARRQVHHLSQQKPTGGNALATATREGGLGRKGEVANCG